MLNRVKKIEIFTISLVAICAFRCEFSESETINVHQQVDSIILPDSSEVNSDTKVASVDILEQGRPFYLGIVERPWYNISETIETTAEVVVYLDSLGEVLRKHVSRGIYNQYFRTDDDSITIEVTKPGYQTYINRLPSEALSQWTIDNPLIVEMSHVRDFRPVNHLVGMTYKSDPFSFMDVDHYGIEKLISYQPYQARSGWSISNPEINRYSYMGYKEDGRQQKSYLISINTLDRSEHKVLISQRMINIVSGSGNDGDDFYAQSRFNDSLIELSAITAGGEQRVISRYGDEYGGVATWAQYDGLKGIYWSALASKETNEIDIIGVDIQDGSERYNFQADEFLLASLSLDEENSFFYGIGMDEENRIIVGKLDMEGNETILWRYELSPYDDDFPARIPWSMYDDVHSQLYIARPIWSKDAGNKTEIIIIDLENGDIIHSFQLKDVGIESLGFRASRLLP